MTPDRAAELAAQAAAVAQLETARTAYRARQDARDQRADAVRVAVAAGITESEAARLAGVTRGTVRAWVGK